MTIGRLINSILMATVLLIGTQGKPATAEQAASKVVGDFQYALLDVMKKGKSLSMRERYDLLAPAIEKAFHLPIMLSMATGNYWREADDRQKRELVNAFKRKNISTVAALFDNYSGHAFEIVGERPAPQNSRLVETRLTRPKGKPVSLDYRVLRVGGQWRIIDVIVSRGISEVAVRRSEYSGWLKDGGIAGLTAVRNAKADELLAETSPGS